MFLKPSVFQLFILTNDDSTVSKSFTCPCPMYRPTFLHLLIRSVSLTKPRLFQDSSLALESFLSSSFFSMMTPESPAGNPKLRSIEISKSVLDLADFDFDPILQRIGDVRNLESVVLQGGFNTF